MEIIYSVFKTILPFEFTQYNFMINALLAVLLITPVFALVGTQVVSSKMSFFSDALGHSALTGIAIGVLLGMENYLLSMIGFALIFVLLISMILDRENSSSDTVIGVFSSVGLALGVVILSAKGGFSKYSAYLIGDILTVTENEILMILALLIAVIIIWIFLYNKLLLVTLNADMASGKNIKVNLIRKIFVIVVALIVTVSIKWIGIMIINSLLVLPAAASRNICKNAKSAHFTAVLIAVVSGVSGLIISYYAGASASAMIVLIAAVFYFATFIYAQIINGR